MRELLVLVWGVYISSRSPSIVVVVFSSSYELLIALALLDTSFLFKSGLTSSQGVTISTKSECQGKSTRLTKSRIDLFRLYVPIQGIILFFDKSKLYFGRFRDPFWAMYIRAPFWYQFFRVAVLESYTYVLEPATGNVSCCAKKSTLYESDDD